MWMNVNVNGSTLQVYNYIIRLQKLLKTKPNMYVAHLNYSQTYPYGHLSLHKFTDFVPENPEFIY